MQTLIFWGTTGHGVMNFSSEPGGVMFDMCVWAPPVKLFFRLNSSVLLRGVKWGVHSHMCPPPHFFLTRYVGHLTRYNDHPHGILNISHGILTILRFASIFHLKKFTPHLQILSTPLVLLPKHGAGTGGKAALWPPFWGFKRYNYTPVFSNFLTFEYPFSPPSYLLVKRYHL